jgi:hypothetical protein
MLLRLYEPILWRSLNVANPYGLFLFLILAHIVYVRRDTAQFGGTQRCC